jgi:uncharacterized protein
MDSQLLEILVCPMCGSKLHFNKKHQILLCQFDRVGYQLDDGVPVLLPEKAKALTSEQLEALNE